jgi:hypothetical protein
LLGFIGRRHDQAGSNKGAECAETNEILLFQLATCSPALACAS